MPTPTPISDARLASLEELSALDQKLELEYGLTGNPLIKAQQRMRPDPDAIEAARPGDREIALLASEVRRLRAVVASEPTLTDAEREALHWFSHYGLPEPNAAALRGLLERLK